MHRGSERSITLSWSTHLKKVSGDNIYRNKARIRRLVFLLYCFNRQRLPPYPTFSACSPLVHPHKCLMMCRLYRARLWKKYHYHFKELLLLQLHEPMVQVVACWTELDVVCFKVHHHVASFITATTTGGWGFLSKPVIVLFQLEGKHWRSCVDAVAAELSERDRCLASKSLTKSPVSAAVN